MEHNQEEQVLLPNAVNVTTGSQQAPSSTVKKRKNSTEDKERKIKLKPDGTAGEAEGADGTLQGSTQSVQKDTNASGESAGSVSVSGPSTTDGVAGSDATDSGGLQTFHLLSLPLRLLSRLRLLLLL